MKSLLGKKVRIISDNENYLEFLNKDLEVTFNSNEGCGYDSVMYPEMLCDFKDVETGEDVPFALYEYEFEII